MQHITGHDVPNSEPFPPELAQTIDRIAQDMLTYGPDFVVRRKRNAGYRPDLQALIDRLAVEYGEE